MSGMGPFNRDRPPGDGFCEPKLGTQPVQPTRSGWPTAGSLGSRSASAALRPVRSGPIRTGIGIRTGRKRSPDPEPDGDEMPQAIRFRPGDFLRPGIKSPRRR